MLKETGLPFGNTSWRWLTSGDEADGLGADEFVNPFDYGVWRRRALPPVLVPTGATYMLERTGDTFVPPDKGTLAAIEGLLRDRLNAVIRQLPHNDLIVNSDDIGADEDAEDHLRALDEDNRAVMNEGGFAQPVAALGAGAMVGTNAVAPCVAVLGRVQLTDGRWRVGCTHLSSVDMESFDQALTAIGDLLAAMAPDAAVDAGPVELYTVGGRDNQYVSYQEFGRLIGAAQEHVQLRGADRLQLAGAVLPANAAGCALAVHISSQGVLYTSDESSAAGESSSARSESDES